QRIGAGLAGAQRDLALGRPASHQNGDVLAHACSTSVAALIRLVPPNRVEIGACVEHLGAALAGCGRGKTSLPKQSGRYATPIRLISHSSSTPEFSLTRRRTVSPSVSMSAAVALPRLIRKLQCISDTCASPTLRPRQPAASMSCHAL